MFVLLCASNILIFLLFKIGNLLSKMFIILRTWVTRLNPKNVDTSYLRYTIKDESIFASKRHERKRWSTEDNKKVM